MAIFDKSRFPPLEDTVRAVWAPIFLSPILGSPERFVVAVASANSRGFHIEQANALQRLTALYGPSAETAIFAVDVALAELRSALSETGTHALKEGASVFSGVRIGEVRSGESSSLAQLSSTWMSTMSSLYKVPDQRVVNTREVSEDERAPADRLPLLVHEHVTAKNPAFASYFSEEIRHRRLKRVRPAGVSIDFHGSLIVANLATLISGSQSKSVDVIKRKMFDLIMQRDRDNKSMFPRTHEMIVFSPTSINSVASQKQLESVAEAHEELREQSIREGFGFIPLSNVATISNRLVEAENRAIH